jgi:hypothetical protein
MSHGRARSYQDRLARARREKMLGLAAGRQIVIRTTRFGVSADYRARPAARIGGVQVRGRRWQASRAT